MLNRSNQFLFLSALIVLIYACAAKEESTERILPDQDDKIVERGNLFRKNHVQFHVSHVDYIVSTKPTLFLELDLIAAFVNDEKGDDVVIRQWSIARDIANEMYYKNSVYIDDCMLMNDTRDGIVDMRNHNSTLYTVFTSNEAEFRTALELDFNTDALATITAIKAELEEQLHQLEQAAEIYVKTIRSFHAD